MAFNQCPLEPKIQTIFQNAPEKFFRKRLPIAERARRADLERAVSYETALRLCAERVFSYGSSRFVLFNSTPIPDERLAALTVSHLGSIFKNSQVVIVMQNDKQGFPWVNVFVYKDNTALPERAEDAALFNSCFHLEFKVFSAWGEMRLCDIESKDSGLGGKALAAVYNIGRELGLGKIVFSVDPKNTNGRQFYFHTDFGRPKPYDFYLWEVDLRKS